MGLVHGWLAALCVLSGGCSLVVSGADAEADAGDPIDVSGAYSCTIVLQENGCMFTNWVEGGVWTAIALAVGQQDDRVTMVVEDPATALVLDLLVGTHAMAGTIDGDRVSLAAAGSATGLPDTPCRFTVNVRTESISRDDTMSGELFFELVYADPGVSAGCAAPVGCVSRQTFNGTRPPR